MIQTITDHNVNADHFFNWMEQHWKYCVGSAADKRAMLAMFEDEAPSGEFTLPEGRLSLRRRFSGFVIY